jgi:ferrochelatase
MSKVAVILNNIGSPESTSPEDVGVYLEEFLMDKEILTLPFLLRYFLVYFLIVPRRKFSSAEKYKKIWTGKKAPLIEISESFAERLQAELGPNYAVHLGMVNGKPSIQTALQKIKDQAAEKIVFAPLYPQYARATSYASEQKTIGLMKKLKMPLEKFKVVKPFYDSSVFVQLSAGKLKKDWSSGKWEYVLFSFHGLPESQIKKNPGCLADENCCARESACAMNCYRAQSLKTAELIAKHVGLTKDQYTICFQSRLGPAQWIGPASLDVVQDLAKRGKKKILVQTPSFVADCLETLEEIAMELKTEFIRAGGEDLQQVPCLNDEADWVKGFAGLVRNT